MLKAFSLVALKVKIQYVGSLKSRFILKTRGRYKDALWDFGSVLDNNPKWSDFETFDQFKTFDLFDFGPVLNKFNLGQIKPAMLKYSQHAKMSSWLLLPSSL